jgi:hypothetical protein
MKKSDHVGRGRMLWDDASEGAMPLRVVARYTTDLSSPHPEPSVGFAVDGEGAENIAHSSPETSNEIGHPADSA